MLFDALLTNIVPVFTSSHAWMPKGGVGVLLAVVPHALSLQPVQKPVSVIGRLQQKLSGSGDGLGVVVPYQELTKPWR